MFSPKTSISSHSRASSSIAAWLSSPGSVTTSWVAERVRDAGDAGVVDGTGEVLRAPRRRPRRRTRMTWKPIATAAQPSQLANAYASLRVQHVSVVRPHQRERDLVDDRAVLGVDGERLVVARALAGAGG